MSSLQFLGQELPGVYDTTLAGTVSTTYLYHEDALGSVRAVTAANGSLTGDGMYYPWGEEWKKTGNAVAMFGGFEGADSVWQEQYVAVHRVYQPNYGRWLTPDPGGIKVVNLADPQTWNMYAYVTDNPTTLNDPTGLGAHCTGQNTEHNNVLTCEQAQAAAQLTATLRNSTQERARQHKAAVIFGETSGLRSEVGKNGKPITTPGADPNLKKARENVADVSARNGRVYSRTPSAAELKNPQVRAAWQASQAAAAASNGSLPGYNFFIRQAGVGPQRPSARAGWGQGKPVREYGPFINVGGGDVPKGPKTYIDIY